MEGRLGSEGSEELLLMLLMLAADHGAHRNFTEGAEGRKLVGVGGGREAVGCLEVLLGRGNGGRLGKLVHGRIGGRQRATVSIASLSREAIVVPSGGNGKGGEVGGRRSSGRGGNTLGVLRRRSRGRVGGRRQKTKSHLVLFLDLLALTEPLQDEFHSLRVRNEGNRVGVTRDGLLLAEIGQNVLVRTNEFNSPRFHAAVHVVGLLTKKSSHLHTNEVAQVTFVNTLQDKERVTINHFSLKLKARVLLSVVGFVRNPISIDLGHHGKMRRKRTRRMVPGHGRRERHVVCTHLVRKKGRRRGRAKSESRDFRNSRVFKKKKKNTNGPQKKNSVTSLLAPQKVVTKNKIEKSLRKFP